MELFTSEERPSKKMKKKGSATNEKTLNLIGISVLSSLFPKGFTQTYVPVVLAERTFIDTEVFNDITESWMVGPEDLTTFAKRTWTNQYDFFSSVPIEYPAGNCPLYLPSAENPLGVPKCPMPVASEERFVHSRETVSHCTIKECVEETVSAVPEFENFTPDGNEWVDLLTAATTCPYTRALSKKNLLPSCRITNAIERICSFRCLAMIFFRTKAYD